MKKKFHKDRGSVVKPFGGAARRGRAVCALGAKKLLEEMDSSSKNLKNTSHTEWIGWVVRPNLSSVVSGNNETDDRFDMLIHFTEGDIVIGTFANGNPFTISKSYIQSECERIA